MESVGARSTLAEEVLLRASGENAMGTAMALALLGAPSCVATVLHLAALGPGGQTDPNTIWNPDALLRSIHSANAPVLLLALRGLSLAYDPGASRGFPGCVSATVLAVNIALVYAAALERAARTLRTPASPARWDARGRHVLLVNPGAENATDHVHRLVTTLTELLNAVDVTAVAPTESETAFYVFKWELHRNDSCTGEADTSSPGCGRCFAEGTVHSARIVPRMPSSGRILLPPFIDAPIPREPRGCELLADGVSWPPYIITDVYANGAGLDGYEVRLLRVMAKHLGVRLRMQIHGPGKWSVAAQNLANGTTDLAFGGFFHLAQFEIRYDATDTYWLEPTVWFVPARLPAPRWLSVVRVFSPALWLAVVAAAMTVAVVPVGPNALDVLRVAVATGAQRPARGAGDRAALAAWLLAGLVLSAAYQSGLVSYLADPGLLPGVDSVDGMMRSPLLFGMHHTSAEFFNRTEGAEDIIRRYVECNDIEACFDRVAKDRDMAMPIEVSYAEWTATRYTKNGKRLVVPIPPPVFTMQNIIVLSNDSYFQDPLNSRIASAVEGGLVAYWWADVMRQAQRVRRVKENQEESSGNGDGPFVIDLSHMHGAYAVLGIGLIASGVVFIAEEFWQRRKLRKKIGLAEKKRH